MEGGPTKWGGWSTESCHNDKALQNHFARFLHKYGKVAYKSIFKINNDKNSFIWEAFHSSTVCRSLYFVQKLPNIQF